jgi:hypothetical protein
MIVDGIRIIAEEGKLLLRKADNQIFGTELYLGYTNMIGGEIIDPPHLEVPEDYQDTDYIEVEGVNYPVTSFDYSYLKDYVVKLKYSPEDQIAILCNIDLDPNNAYYIQRYNDMQAWREVAGEIAKKYSKQ